MGKKRRRRSSNGSAPTSPTSTATNKKSKGSTRTSTNRTTTYTSATGTNGTPSVYTETGSMDNRSEMDGFGRSDEIPIATNNHQHGSLPAKIPPLVVKNMPLDILKKDLRAAGIVAQFKLTGIGIKVLVHTREALDATKVLLQRKKAEFFTHDIPEEKPFKAVIRGLPIMEKEEIEAELIQHYKLHPVAIHVISRKNNEGKDYRDCLYLVHFRKGSTTLNALKAVRQLNDMIVTWEAYRGSNRDVTQCMRCLNFGHGTRNCCLKPRCNFCARPHLSTECPHEDVAAFKCVNCGGGHKASDKVCPKREAYKKIRKDAAMRNQPGKRIPLNQPLFRPEDFPALNQQQPTQQQQPIYNTKPWPRQPRTTTPSPPKQKPKVSATTTKQNSYNTPFESNSQEPLYGSEELVKIFLTMSSKLKMCKTKHEQIEMLGVFIIQYG